MKFTEAAHQSTVEMQETNQAMHLIAKQTKREAVSMRILTIVTLFFLPGTFISVSHLGTACRDLQLLI
jgi:hypothetical protein